VVVQEKTAPIKGRFVEVVGYYSPTGKEKVIKFELDRIKYWLSVGAQPSDTVASLLKKEGVSGMEKYIAPRDKKRKKKNPTEEEQAAAAPAEQSAPQEAPATEAPAPEAAPAEEPKAEEKPQEPATEAPAQEAAA
jgi:small subunit ribosomal protein S16